MGGYVSNEFWGKKGKTMIGDLGRVKMDQNPTKTHPLVPTCSLIVHGPLRGLNKEKQKQEKPSKNPNY